MKVKVVPIRPIPGILPKNKWIDTEMELDLNKKEIMRCMQDGNVYDFLDNVIDSNYITTFDEHVKAYYNHVQIIEHKEEVQSTITVASTTDEPIVIDMLQDNIPNEIVINEEDNDTFENIIPYVLDVLSCEKEEDYIILETQFICNYSEKLTGDLYGLFKCTSGARPSVEYKNNEEWKKFNNAFSNFSELQNKTKFIFRFIPKNNSEVEFDLSIKNGKDLVAIISITINPDEL